MTPTNVFNPFRIMACSEGGGQNFKMNWTDIFRWTCFIITVGSDKQPIRSMQIPTRFRRRCKRQGRRVRGYACHVGIPAVPLLRR